MKTRNSYRGFTLIELMIAVAIVGLLASIALPSYESYVRKGNRTDCQGILFDASSRLERFYYDNDTYTIDMTDLGYTSDDDVPSPEGHYTFDVLAATGSCPLGSCFVLQCTAVGSQVPDGNLTLNSSGQKLPADKW